MKKKVTPDFPTMQAKFDEFMRLIQINPTERAVKGKPVTIDEIAKHLNIYPLTVWRWNKALHKKGRVLPLPPPSESAFLDSEQVVEAIERVENTLKKSALKSKRKDNDKVFQFEIGDEQLLNERPKEWLKQQLPQIFKALVASCVKGNPVATKLVCELVDPEYKQKQESGHINADIIARLVFEAERESQRGGSSPDTGVGAVSGVPLLSQELRLPSGQNTAKDSQI